MGLFKKKEDPISERARILNAEIAALENQIKALDSGKSETPERNDLRPAPEAPVQHSPADQFRQSEIPHQFRPLETPYQEKQHENGPRLRSTAMPHGPTVFSHMPGNVSSGKVPEPVFESVDHNRLKSPSEQTNKHFNELGMRKYDLAGFFERFKAHFQHHSHSNPKLVNLLAAGSVQGLRSLRYEKRVSRNRFFLVIVIVIIIGLGILVTRHP